MIQEIGYGVWTYSAYLTLKEWQVVLYAITLFFGICYGFFNLFSHNDLNLLFYILNLIYYGCALFFLLRAYKNFRVTGGIHGKLGVQKVKENQTSKDVSPEKKKTKKKMAKKEGLTDRLLEEPT